MASNLPADSVKHWQTFAAGNLAFQLRRARVYLVEQHGERQQQTHLASCLNLLRLSRGRNDLDEERLSLMEVIHAPILASGAWEVWMDEIHHALRICRRRGRNRELSRWLLRLMALYLQSGRLRLAEELVEEAVQQAAGGDPADLAEIVAVIAQLFSRLGRQAEIPGLVARLDGYEPATLSGEEMATVNGYKALAMLHWHRQQGELEVLLQALETAVDEVSRLAPNQTVLLAELHDNRANMLWVAARYRESETVKKQAIARYRALADDFAVATAESELGLILWSLCRFGEAERLMRHCVMMSEQLNARWRLVIDIGNLGVVYLSRGRFEEGWRYVQRHEELALAINDVHEQTRAKGNRGLYLIYMGRHEAAREPLVWNLERVRDNRLIRIYCLINLGYWSSCVGDRDGASAFLEEAAGELSQVSAPVLELFLWRCQALLADRPAAIALLEQALDRARRLERPFDEAACLLSMAGLSRGEARKRLWTGGEGLLHRLGAADWLEHRSPAEPPFLAMLM